MCQIWHFWWVGDWEEKGRQLFGLVRSGLTTDPSVSWGLVGLSSVSLHCQRYLQQCASATNSTTSSPLSCTSTSIRKSNTATLLAFTVLHGCNAAGYTAMHSGKEVSDFCFCKLRQSKKNLADFCGHFVTNFRKEQWISERGGGHSRSKKFPCKKRNIVFRKFLQIWAQKRQHVQNI